MVGLRSGKPADAPTSRARTRLRRRARVPRRACLLREMKFSRASRRRPELAPSAPQPRRGHAPGEVCALGDVSQECRTPRRRLRAGARSCAIRSVRAAPPVVVDGVLCCKLFRDRPRDLDRVGDRYTGANHGPTARGQFGLGLDVFEPTEQADLPRAIGALRDLGLLRPL